MNNFEDEVIRKAQELQSRLDRKKRIVLFAKVLKYRILLMNACSMDIIGAHIDI